MCAVPATWLLNNNCLVYPPKATAAIVVTGLIRSSAQPQNSWDKFAYVNKKKFNSCAEAEAYVEANGTVESDADDNRIEQLQRIQRSLTEAKNGMVGCIIHLYMSLIIFCMLISIYSRPHQNEGNEGV